MFLPNFTSKFDDEPFRPISTPHSQPQPFLKKEHKNQNSERRQSRRRSKDKKSKNATTSRTVLLPPLSLSSDPQLPVHSPSILLSFQSRQLPSQLTPRTPIDKQKQKKNTNPNFTSSFSQFKLPRPKIRSFSTLHLLHYTYTTLRYLATYHPPSTAARPPIAPSSSPASTISPRPPIAQSALLRPIEAIETSKRSRTVPEKGWELDRARQS